MTADPVGGVWTYALELARALAGNGTEVILATMGAPLRPAQRRQAEGIRLYESAFKLEWMRDPWCDLERAGEWLLDLEAQLRPDVVHLNGYVHAALPWKAPVMVVAHSCVLSWWQAVKGEPAPAEWEQYHAAVATGVRAARLVVAPSRAMAAEVERYYEPARSVLVIPNGRAAERFSPREKQPFALAAGRLWDEAKNLGTLDAATAGLSWPVYVAGDTRHPDGTERAGANVRMLGILDPPEMAGWMARASVYALPARYEPFGLSALEAALCGCALVLGGIPSLRENWERAADFVDPADPGELHAALERMARDFAHRGRMAAAARRRAAGFTPERMATSYTAAYDAMI